jgi:DNA repair protein RecN (Recombination protein N)
MLQALSIRDFAIIDRVDLELGAGLTVITGETGAGKSILINALKLVLGGRASTDVVRTGSDAAEVEALFDLADAPDVRRRLVELGLDDADQIIVRRVLSTSGRHRVYVNGAMATVQMLAQLTSGLVDISGQHEHYSLLRAEAHADLLDRVAGLGVQREAVTAAYERVASIDERLDALRTDQRGRTEREEFLKFQLQELEAANLKDPAEEQNLEQERHRLRNSEKIRDAAAGAEALLSGDDGGAAGALAKALRYAETLAGFDPEMRAVADDLRTAHALADDAARTVGRYAEHLEADPERLDQLETRLAQLARLRRKHGATLGDVIARRDAIRAELSGLANVDDTLEQLEKARGTAAADLLRAADTLGAARREGARRFTDAVCAELADLGMGGATLEVRFEPLTSGVRVGDRFVGARGANRVEFLMSANPGETPAPLHKIASGGELSRFMLAVKRVIAERDPVATYVFDEVDTGVGGPTAEAIGRKLEAVSTRRQALCITHLPQIAAFGQRHLHVHKRVDGDRTRSEVTPLDADARVEELARMLGGARITEAMRANARELLSHALAAAPAPKKRAQKSIRS